LDSFMWGSYPASLRNVGGSTQVPVSAWNNARKGTRGFPVSMLRNTQNKQTKNSCNMQMALCLEKAVNYALLNLRYIWYCIHVTDRQNISSTHAWI
jgi:hypothetical protein